VKIAESSSDLFLDAAGRQRFRAPEGHQLVAAVLTPSSRFEADEVPTARVEVGQDDDAIDMPGPGEAVVAVVPRGESARLVVGDLGRTQSIDLRTGERGDDAIEGFYTDVGQVVEHTYTGSGTLPPLIPPIALPPPYPPIESPPVASDVEIGIDAVLRRPWVPGAGYAADGRAWLMFETTVQVVPTGASVCGVFLQLPAELTFTLVDEAGRQLRPQPGFVGELPSSVVVIDVPADFTTGTLRIDPGASPLLDTPPVDMTPCAWVTPPPAGTLALHLSEP
jgi:hypothetical protein